MLTKFPQGFKPILTQGDTEELSLLGERLLIYFPRRWEVGLPVETKIGKVGEIQSGWVIGLKTINFPKTDGHGDGEFDE